MSYKLPDKNYLRQLYNSIFLTDDFDSQEERIPERKVSLLEFHLNALLLNNCPSGIE